jgi:uncharacterized protein
VWRRLPWWLGRLAVAQAVAFGIWAFVVNRSLIQTADYGGKDAVIAALGLGLSGLAALSVLRFRGRPVMVFWLALLGLFAAGELRRAWLRWEYRADSRATPAWPALTTTNLEVRTFPLAVPALGAARVRVLHVTDLHIHDQMPASFSEGVAQRMRELSPDLLLLTGDFVSHADRLGALERWLPNLPRPPLGSYAVLGNHDVWIGRADEVRAILTRAGIEVLSGRCADVAVPGAPPLSVCGTETPWGPDYSPAAPGSAAATLVLSHTPDNVYTLAERGADAVFSGHTHAGQVRVPWLGAVIVPSDYGRRFDEGHFQIGRTHLFVSAGVGADAPTFRLWCPPELIVVELTGSASAGSIAER